jgi:hypothetical protein
VRLKFNIFTVQEDGATQEVEFDFLPAGFGQPFNGDTVIMASEMIRAEPYNACDPLTNAPGSVQGKIVLSKRGACAFTAKAQNAMDRGTSSPCYSRHPTPFSEVPR